MFFIDLQLVVFFGEKGYFASSHIDGSHYCIAVIMTDLRVNISLLFKLFCAFFLIECLVCSALFIGCT